MSVITLDHKGTRGVDHIEVSDRDCFLFKSIFILAPVQRAAAAVVA